MKPFTISLLLSFFLFPYLSSDLAQPLPFTQHLAAPEEAPPLVGVSKDVSLQSSKYPVDALPQEQSSDYFFFTADDSGLLYGHYDAVPDADGQRRIREVVERKKMNTNKERSLIQVQRHQHVIADMRHVVISGERIIWLETELRPSGVLGEDWSLWTAQRDGSNVQLLDEQKAFKLKPGFAVHNVPYGFSVSDDSLVFASFDEVDGSPARVIRQIDLASGEKTNLAFEPDYTSRWYSNPSISNGRVAWSVSHSSDGIVEEGETVVYDIKKKKSISLKGASHLLHPRLSGDHLVVRCLPEGKRLRNQENGLSGSELWHYDLSKHKWTWRLNGRLCQAVDFENPQLRGDWLLCRSAGAKPSTTLINMSTGRLIDSQKLKKTIPHQWLATTTPAFSVESRGLPRQLQRIDLLETSKDQ